MMISEDFLKYLTLSLILFKKNEKYKMEIKKEIKEKMPKFRELIKKDKYIYINTLSPNFKNKKLSPYIWVETKFLTKIGFIVATFLLKFSLT
ncbi:hypothetical protein [Borreliella bavariensis]|uniref:hypothetical protein n=2 Tax=Borreliella bavariensis TaxID=664662 RepID=UPI001BFFF271|nr:hypothetical protein [Borreliella bavariensis]